MSARLARYASRRDVQIVPLAHVIANAGESYKGQRITAPKPLADSDGGECPARAPSHTSTAVRFRPRKRRREWLCFGMGLFVFSAERSAVFLCIAYACGNTAGAQTWRPCTSRPEDNKCRMWEVILHLFIYFLVVTEELVLKITCNALVAQKNCQ